MCTSDQTILNRDQMARWNTPWHDMICDGRRICKWATDLASVEGCRIEPGSRHSLKASQYQFAMPPLLRSPRSRELAR